MGDDMAMNTFDLERRLHAQLDGVRQRLDAADLLADGTTLTPTSCPLGCADTPTPHCKAFVPSAPAMASDLQTGLADTVMTTGVAYLVNTDDGSITNIRAAGSGTLAQIVYRATAPGTNDPGAGVFGFNSLEIQEGATLQAVGAARSSSSPTRQSRSPACIDARGYNPTPPPARKLCNTRRRARPGRLRRRHDDLGQGRRSRRRRRRHGPQRQ